MDEDVTQLKTELLVIPMGESHFDILDCADAKVDCQSLSERL